MTWKLGTVGHFGIRVRDPKKSARWWVKNIGMRVAFEFEDGVAVESRPEAPGSPHLALWFHDPDGYRWELSVQNGAKEKKR
jgi:hypothetical protein